MTDPRADYAPPERWQHGTLPIIGADGIQRVQRPVDVLLHAGRIDDAAVTAAERYYRDYAVAWEMVAGERNASRDPHQAYFGARAAVDGTDLHTTAHVHPRHLMALAVLCDVCVEAIAAFYRLPVGQIQEWLVAVLATNTAYYADFDGARPAPESGIRAAGVR